MNDRLTGKIRDFGPLFEYAIKLVLLVSFLELILYRLLSRLGMHMSKVAASHPWITPTFSTLTAIGAWLLNIVAVLLFLSLAVTMVNCCAGSHTGRLAKWAVGCAALLLSLTVVFLFVEPGMLGAIVYNGTALVTLTLLVIEYWTAQRERLPRAFAVTFYCGVAGWLYYQIVSTIYSLVGTLAAPPLVYEVHRGGEALMVAASILTFAAYGRGLSLRTKNRTRLKRAVWFWFGAGTIFTGLICTDYLLELYDPAMASAIRQASQGIGWIFQFGMGYTFYLPFALYVAGVLCWSYTVIKLLMMGRVAGYGLGLMFMAGYALMFSNLTLMVVLGMMLLVLDRTKARAAGLETAGEDSLLASPKQLIAKEA